MLVENRKKVSEYQKTLNSHMEAAVERNKAECNAEITALVQRKKEPVDHDKIKTKAELFNEYSHLLKGDAKKEYKEAVASGQPDKNRIYQNKDLENIFKEMERLKATEKEAREDLLEMQNLIRKQRMMQNFKWVIQQRKWDAKIENLR
jgi:erythromycin esterase-like protein